MKLQQEIRRLQALESHDVLDEINLDREILRVDNETLKEEVRRLEEFHNTHFHNLCHANHQQKIHYTRDLKKENDHLRTELKKLRQLNVQLRFGRKSSASRTSQVRHTD